MRQEGKAVEHSVEAKADCMTKRDIALVLCCKNYVKFQASQEGMYSLMMSELPVLSSFNYLFFSLYDSCTIIILHFLKKCLVYCLRFRAIVLCAINGATRARRWSTSLYCPSLKTEGL